MMIPSALVLFALAQSAPPSPTKPLPIGKMEVKPKDGCCTKGAAKPWEGYDKGILWRQDGSSWAAAKEAKKLVLYFELVGDLDKEGC